MFAPSIKDAVAIRMDDQDSMLGENNLAAKIGKGVWGKEGITCPCIAAGGRDGAEAGVALATDRTGRPFATRTPMEGAVGLRIATGALDAK